MVEFPERRNKSFKITSRTDRRMNWMAIGSWELGQMDRNADAAADCPLHTQKGGGVLRGFILPFPTSSNPVPCRQCRSWYQNAELHRILARIDIGRRGGTFIQYQVHAEENVIPTCAPLLLTPYSRAVSIRTTYFNNQKRYIRIYGFRMIFIFKSDYILKHYPDDLRSGEVSCLLSGTDWILNIILVIFGLKGLMLVNILLSVPVTAL